MVPSPVAAESDRISGASGASTATGGSVSAYGIATSGDATHRGGGVSSIYCEIYHASGSLGSGVSFGVGAPATAVSEGDVVIQRCFDRDTGRPTGAPRIVTIGPGAAPVVSIDALVAAAMAQLDVEPPVMAQSPEGGVTLPHIDTWFWMTNTAPRSRSASAAGVTATVTSTLEELVVDAGSDGSARCPDGGVAFDLTVPSARQTSRCVIYFNGPTRDVDVAATAVWRVTWSATTGEAGDLGAVSRTTALTVGVQELATTIRSE